MHSWPIEKCGKKCLYTATMRKFLPKAEVDQLEEHIALVINVSWDRELFPANKKLEGARGDSVIDKTITHAKLYLHRYTKRSRYVSRSKKPPIYRVHS